MQLSKLRVSLVDNYRFGRQNRTAIMYVPNVIVRS